MGASESIAAATAPPLSTVDASPLAIGDVAAVLALSDAAGWNQTEDDWTFFIERATTFGLRDERGAVVATAAALPYDNACGWVSMVLVDERHRHRGIATGLVERAVDALRARSSRPLLDATAAGAAVYRRLGFRDGFEYERWQRPATVGDAGARPLPAHRDEAVVAAEAPATETLRRLDEATSGLARRAMWDRLLARASTKAWLAPSADGFVVVREGRRATQIGPLVAAGVDDAVRLLGVALDRVAGAAFIDVPLAARDFARTLAGAGFVRQRSFVRMSHGEPAPRGSDPRVFAFAGPEYG